MKRHILTALALAGAVTVTAALFALPAEAQFFTPQPRNQFSSFEMPDTTHLRVLAIVLSGAIGFGLGWLVSPLAKQFRFYAAIAVSAVILLTAIVDNGFLGWSFTSLASMVAFAWGIGYWLGQVAKSFLTPPTTHGSAKWATVPYLHEHGLLGKGGFRLGFSAHEGKFHGLHYTSDRHLLTIAPNRSGKGTTGIIPNLLTYLGSILTIDPKGENAMITAEHRRAMGQEVHIVDPWGITGMDSSRFNPIDWLLQSTADIVENAMILADAIVVAMGKDNLFWDEEAKALIQGLLVYVATALAEAGNRTLGRVRDILLLDGEDLRAVFKLMLESEYHIVRSTAARCLQKDEKLLANVIASTQAHTHFLDSARIRESLSASDFKFEDLKTKRLTVYLVLPADRLNTFGRWLRLLIQQALTVNARNIETRPEKPVLFLLDEMAALGRLTMVEQAFGLMAGYGIQMWGIVQDLSQLKRIYGDGWETFISNAGVLQYFGSRDRMSAEYFSALCGVTTIWNISTAIARAFSKSSGAGAATTTSESVTDTETTAAMQRKLAYPDELMRMHKSKQLVLIENHDPILCYRRPWFEDPELKSLGRNLHLPEAPSSVGEETAADKTEV